MSPWTAYRVILWCSVERNLILVTRQQILNTGHLSLTPALSKAGKHMEDSVLASYAALLLGLLVKHSSVSSTCTNSPIVSMLISQEFGESLKAELPNRSFALLIEVLKKFLSFMQITVCCW